MKNQLIEKTIGNAPMTKSYRSLDEGSSIMALVVETEINGTKAPHEITIWMEHGDVRIRAEFSLEQTERFALELLKLTRTTMTQEIEIRPETRGNL